MLMVNQKEQMELVLSARQAGRATSFARTLYTAIQTLPRGRKLAIAMADGTIVRIVKRKPAKRKPPQPIYDDFIPKN